MAISIKESDAAKLAALLKEIEERKSKYGITSVSMERIAQQKKLFSDMKSRMSLTDELRPRFYLYYGGNGAGKTFVGAYITVLLALGNAVSRYGLPFLGWKKNVWILTKSGSNVKSVIEPYLLGENSMTRIPPEQVSKVNRDNGILKQIVLANGTIIDVKTYDQGSENLQGGNPDWIWMDEEPVNEDVFTEIIARTRRKECELLITMTPLNGLTRVYEYFLDQQSEKVRNASRVYVVSSMDNPFTDKTWAEGLSEDEYRLRVLGSFESPTGLVYSSFYRPRNIIPHFEPREMGDNVRYYRSIDFGVSHPTGVIFLAQDEDDNFYVYDEIYESNMLIRDLAKKINDKSGVTSFEYTLRDAAALREGIELANFGIKTVPADKHSKGENDMSNRKAGIMLVNQLLHDGKLMVSDRCRNLIKEFETHYYKENGKRDGEVNKIDDDLLDALRYVIFNIKKNVKKGKSKTELHIDRESGNLRGIQTLKKSPFLRF